MGALGPEQWALLGIVAVMLFVQLGLGSLARLFGILLTIVTAWAIWGTWDRGWGFVSLFAVAAACYVVHDAGAGLRRLERLETAEDDESRAQLDEAVRKRDVVAREQEIVNAELEASQRLYQMSRDLGSAITMSEFHREVGRLVREMLMPKEAVLVYLDIEKGAPHTYKAYDLGGPRPRSLKPLPGTHPLWEHFRDPTGAGVMSNVKTERGEEVVIFVTYQGRIAGGLYLLNPAPTRTLGMDARSLLYTLAVQTNLALNKCLLYLQIERMSRRDALTGVYKRWWFMELLEDEFMRAANDNRPLTLLMIDIDHFKDFNDTYGHLAGDKVLSAVAMYLKEHVRVQDILCRYGGEEFVVALPDTPREGALVVAERLRATVAERPVQVSGSVASITISIGGATYPRDVKDINALIELADSEMYRSKQVGRNKVSFPGMEPAGPGLPEEGAGREEENGEEPPPNAGA